MSVTFPVRRLIVALAVVLIAVAGWAAPATAHAVLQSTNPPSGAVLQKSPGTVVLHFSEGVEVQFGAVRVFSSSGARIDTGNASHADGDGRAVAVSVPQDLSAGGYVVTWRVISSDAHPVHGAFTFQIGGGGAGSAVASKAEATKLLAAAGGSRSVGVLFGIIRFLEYAALFVLVGGAAFVAGAWPDGAALPRVRRLLWGGWLVAVATTALAICIQGPYGGGLALGRMLSPSVVSSVLHTRFGQVYLARLIVLAAMAAPLLRFLLHAGPRPRRWVPAAIATGAVILITPGLAGHSGTGSLVALALPFDLVHLAALAVWLGGLAVLAVALLAPRGEGVGAGPLATVLPRYSQWALGAVLAVAVSGGFAAWRQVGSLSAVTTTPYGRLLLAKTVVFAVLVAVASTSRRLVHGSVALPFGLGRRAGRRVGTGHGAVAMAGAGPVAVATGISANGALPAVAVPVAAPVPGPVTAPVPTGATTTGPTAPAHAPAPAPATRTARTLTGRGSAPGRGVAPRRPPRREGRRVRLRKAVLAELALAAAAVAVAAMLVNAQPARQAVAAPFSAEVRAGDHVLVDVVVDPAKAGPVALHLYTLGVDGSQLDVPEVIATLSLVSAGIADLKVPLLRAGTGHFVAYGFDVPLRGTWKLQMTVRTSEVDEVYADPVTVRMR